MTIIGLITALLGLITLVIKWLERSPSDKAVDEADKALKGLKGGNYGKVVDFVRRRTLSILSKKRPK